MALLSADALIDQFADALIVVAPDGRVLLWSAGAQDIYGYAPDEALGRTLLDLIVPPEHGAAEQARLVDAWQTSAASFECTRRRKDGALVYVDASVRAV